MNEVSSIFMLNWLLYVEETQKMLKSDDVQEKKRFWTPTVDLVHPRPVWLQQFESSTLIPGFCDNIVPELLSSGSDLEGYLKQTLESLQQNKHESFSSRVDLTLLSIYLKKSKKCKKGTPRIIYECDLPLDPDILYGTRMIAGCFRNFVILKLLQKTIPEEGEIYRYIKMTLDL
jgi:hypothetical protein